MKSVPELRHRVLDVANELKDAQRQYLERCGWKHTSETPSALWLWVREIGGVKWGVPLETALMIQQAIDNH